MNRRRIDLVPARRRLLVLASKAPGISPSQRFRLEQWQPYLAETHSIDLEFSPFESRRLTDLLYEPGRVPAKALLTVRDFLRRALVLPRVHGYDAIVVHREAALIGPAIYERLLSWTGVPLIYDFDDAIWSDAQLTVNGVFSRLHFFSKTASICRMADAVTTGNEFLARYARQRNPSVSVVPSSIELNAYPVSQEPPSGRKFIVAWTGSTSTLAHFEFAREALELLARRVRLVVKIICSKPPEQPIAGADTQFVPWSSEREAHDVADCHVGIMPLPDNEATRGKSGMKALQFMATGRPVVVSPVGVNTSIVTPGENGLFAGTQHEWVAALEALAHDHDLRHRLGANARRTVESRFAASMSASKFAAVVHNVLGEHTISAL
jgi:glycosyltransferase involved in cell wall biosynthesis